MKSHNVETVLNTQSEAPITPYQKAKQEWDERIGSAVIQAKNWRFVAVLALIISIILLGLLIASFALNSNHIFIAEVAKSGRVINVVPLKQTYEPTDAQKSYFVANFIKLIRSLPLDPVVAKDNWNKSYAFLTQRSSEYLNQYFKKHNPLDNLGKQTVMIKINDLNPISPSTYEAEWTEIITNIEGQEAIQKKMSGVFTLSIKTPTDPALILKNPLGIYIIDFHLSERAS